jgi:chromosome segregation ATPase
MNAPTSIYEAPLDTQSIYRGDTGPTIGASEFSFDDLVINSAVCQRAMTMKLSAHQEENPQITTAQGKTNEQQDNHLDGVVVTASPPAPNIIIPGRMAQMVSLQQRLLQEQERYQTLQREHENQLRDEQHRFQTSQQQIRDLEQTMHDHERALTVAQKERDTAMEEAREARQSHAATLQTIRNLETEVQTREEDLRSLQWRYNHVDQEYRRLLCEMVGNGQTSQQQIRDLERTMRDREQVLTVAQRERDTAMEEAREARQSHAATLQTIRSLETEVQTREEGLRSLQWRYDHVDQEYRRLLFEMAGSSQTLRQQIHDLEQTMHDREQALTVAQRERDTAIEEARETRQSHVATLQTIQNLETEAQTREEDLRSLQQRYDHVDQENRRLMYEMGNIGVARSVE